MILCNYTLGACSGAAHSKDSGAGEVLRTTDLSYIASTLYRAHMEFRHMHTKPSIDASACLCSRGILCNEQRRHGVVRAWMLTRQ